MSRPETGRTGARFGAPARRSRPTVPDEADGTPAGDGPAPEAAETDDEVVGLTGARFGGRARKSRRERQAEKARAEAGDTGPGAAERDAERADERDDERDDERPTVELPQVPSEPDPGRAAAAEPEPAAVAVRPYVLTGGRTRVRAELRIETLVSTVSPPPAGAGGPDTGERRTVLELCGRPRSVSEVAALTKVPLGVARVLLDDLATEGRVLVHLGVDAATGPDLELMNRVLSGLRRL